MHLVVLRCSSAIAVLAHGQQLQSKLVVGRVAELTSFGDPGRVRIFIQSRQIRNV